MIRRPSPEVLRSHFGQWYGSTVVTHQRRQCRAYLDLAIDEAEGDDKAALFAGEELGEVEELGGGRQRGGEMKVPFTAKRERQQGKDGANARSESWQEQSAKLERARKARD